MTSLTGECLLGCPARSLAHPPGRRPDAHRTQVAVSAQPLLAEYRHPACPHLPTPAYTSLHLPACLRQVLHDDRTNADAIVAWDDATKTAYFLF